MFRFLVNAISIGTVDVRNNDSGASRRELPGKLAADALSGSGDDYDPISDVEITRVWRNARILRSVDRRGMSHAEFTCVFARGRSRRSAQLEHHARFTRSGTCG